MKCSFDLQGHRGARGLAPENTLPGFAAALAAGVTTLELDTAVTKDGVVVVAHDRKLNPDITRNAAGQWIATPSPPVCQLAFDELQTFDVGRINPDSDYFLRFPNQAGQDGVRMPSLASVFDMCSSTQVRFNIETKLSPLAPDEALAPSAYVDSLLEVIEHAAMAHRVTVQSFDWRTLSLIKNCNSVVRLSYLTSADTLPSTGASLWTDGFQLERYRTVPLTVAAASSGRQCCIWSPEFRTLAATQVHEALELGLEVLPWTVNESDDMLRAIQWGASGFITDFPDRARETLAKQGFALPKQWHA